MPPGKRDDWWGLALEPNGPIDDTALAIALGNALLSDRGILDPSELANEFGA